MFTTIDDTQSASNNPMSESILLLKQLGAQFGFCGSLVVERYQELSKKDFLNRYADQIPKLDSDDKLKNSANVETSGTKPGLSPMVQDHAFLANILTQIQYDLCDFTLVLDHSVDRSKSRIDNKSISWLSDIVAQMVGKLPDHQEPVLPIGNKIASSFWIAASLCELIRFKFAHFNTDEFAIEREYLKVLTNFLHISARWSNLSAGEREWFWKPKSQMQQQDN